MPRLLLLLACLCWCARAEGPWAALRPENLLEPRDVAVKTSSEDEVCSKNIDIRNSVSSFRKLENCSVIEGSLQILLIDKAEHKDFENLTFPKLQEITGYLLLYRIQGLQSLSKLFPNLAVIRGDVLFHNYALVIYELRAIQDVGLVSLTTILRGSVRIEKNPHLCYVDTINWDYIAKAGRGGHFIKDNKPYEECPNTCPVADCPTVPHARLQRQQKLCWNSHTCQNICNIDCEHRNLTCSSRNVCCHQECLGGCHGKLSDKCIACRHVVFKGKCMRRCPPGTFKYLDRRCIEEDECKNVTNRMLDVPMNQEVKWKPFRGECLPHCPSGFAINETNKHECIKCDGQCPKICDGAVVDSVGSAQKLKGCTYVNGSLEIQIQGGENIINELETSLSSIQMIRGYLKIARSFPLISLHFLRDLVEIQGEQLDKKEYALLVLDNQNLQELWNWESRKTKLRISRGKIFFHFNSKLCPNKIEELKNYSYVRNWDDRDVSPSSNGDRVACNVVDMDMVVWRVGSVVAGLRWKNFRKTHTDMDFRSLLGYVVYYREAPDRNVTIFDGRDACGADVWKVDDVEADEDAEYVITLLTHLKPYTTYATYMRTYTIASAVVGAQTPIIYFTTKPDTPSPPVNVQAVATSQGEIIISWSPPKRPNGNVTHYIIEGYREKDSSEFISQRNYCNEPLAMSDFKKTKGRSEAVEDVSPEGKEEKKGLESEKCCSCSKTKSLPDQGEDAESQIQFEDFIHNSVFIKNPNAGKLKTENATVTLLPTSASFESSTEFFNESYMHILGSPSSLSTVVENVTEIASTVPPELEEGRFRYVVYDEKYLVVKNLHHFTEYTIEVKACQEPAIDLDECSSQAITTIRTWPLDGADDIDVSSIVIITENATSGIITVKWDEPKNYNGLILNYYIEVKSVEASDHQPTPHCITQWDFQKKMYYTLGVSKPGNYSLRIRATSLATSGNWTSPVHFVIPDAKGGLWRSEMLSLFIVGIVAFIFISFGVPFYFYYKKRYGNAMPTMLYASVNPEYMSAVYEPDEWEVARDKITLIQELGQGSFGMVYKGEYKTEDRGNLKCAVKTVNESASLRERIEFLQEASVMKAFNCHHVVKLLGVVSKGHPTLVIMELMGKGDLKAYLRSRRPEENIENPDIHAPTLREILQMAIEIADGMAYLAAKKFVHRDLAARNCMVSDDMTVKIGDFGMTRDIYETDYYRKGGKGLLPVRWMAPECLKDGLFSSQSDIWSYGVVLWEMATLASQPYQGLSNEQVLQFVMSGGKMTMPENCPEKIYALMDLCWNKNPKARPTFAELIEMLLPDIDQAKFNEVSFYFTQRQETSAKETELCDSATASTPMRIQWTESQNSEDNEPEVTFFPPTRNVYRTSYHEEDNNYQARSYPEDNSYRTSYPEDNNYHQGGAKGDNSRAYSVHSNEGRSATSSDDSKGSKVSSVSNGSIANGHVSFVPGRTTMC